MDLDHIIEIIQSPFYYDKLKEDPSLLYKKYTVQEQRILLFAITCLFSVGCYFMYQFVWRMPLYMFEQSVVYPLSFALEERSKNISFTLSKLNVKHIFFSLAINFIRLPYITDYASTNISIISKFNFFNSNLDLLFEEDSKSEDVLFEFPENNQRTPLHLFYIKQGINFSTFDADFELISNNFDGIIRTKITIYTINANTWNFTILFRTGAFFAASYFLLGVLLSYKNNENFPNHIELPIIIIIGIFGINIFQIYAKRQFLWFRYSYLFSTFFYACFRIYTFRLLNFLNGKIFDIKFDGLLKITVYLSLFLAELIEIYDVVSHSSNSGWLYNPNNEKSIADYLIYGFNFYYCLVMFLLLIKIFSFMKITGDETKKFVCFIFLTFIGVSVLFNFYTECYFSNYKHMRQNTVRFFLEIMISFLVLFGLSFIHNTKSFSFDVK